MREFKEMKSIDDIESFINKHTLAFLYITRPNCSVCHGLKPQVLQLMEKYPEIQLGSIDTLEVEEVAGYFSIFTVPVLLLFVEGKEYVREARIVHMDLYEEKLDNIYENVVGS
ncbi:thioredoxin family protein [Oceanobacillus halotolerans]|uniref:thioredoxin family protein n=1 Tax=Oceanobacillus halotolerans TaxID=2663380 RepID=UPI0013D86844|nr:thioredoxin family protein [Oceanobacillus halotolerans]